MTPPPVEILVARYVKAWNEPEPEVRRRQLEMLYTSDGYVATQSGYFAGIDAMVEHIGAVFDEFIGSGRYQFRSGGAVGHHGCILFRWEMVDADTGELADAGVNLFLLAPDGRLSGDHQFVLGVDSSIGSAAVQS